MGFTAIDAIIVLVYLAGTALFGVLMGGRQTSARDYFLSERPIPWWAICLTIVATETSALTFLSLPGMAWAGSMVFLQLALGYILGRILVAIFFIPRYFEGSLETAYALLGQRFGNAVRRSSSAVFMLTRLFADGVRLYTTAIPLALLLRGFDVLPAGHESTVYLLSMAVLTVLTLVYVFAGGIRAVIWTDVLQWVVYVLGAVVSLYVLADMLPMPLGQALTQAVDAGKFDVFRWPGADWISEPYTVLSGVLGGALLSMASHGTDHLIVQRVLAAKHPTPARKAMVLSGVVVLLQFAIFLVVGVLLWAYDPVATGNPNEVFAAFILEHLPVGVRGLIVAGILAAAMSTLSSSISALGSTTMMDFILPLRRSPLTAERALTWSRRISVLWAFILLGAATVFIGTPKAVVELALSIASYTYGGLLGLFVLGVLPVRLRSRAVLIGFVAGIAGAGAAIAFTALAWTWYTLVGAAITVAVALLAHHIFPSTGQGVEA